MKLFKFLGVILIALAGLAQCGEVRNPGLFDELDKYWLKIAKFTPEVKKINKHLEKNVGDPNDRKQSLYELEKLAAESVKNKPLHQAIMTIIGLDTVLDPETGCDGRSFVILAEAYILIGGEPDRGQLDHLSRLEQLVLGYGYEHKRLCLPHYIEKFEKRIESVRAQQDGQMGEEIDDLRELFSHEFVTRLSNRSDVRINSAKVLETKMSKFRVLDSVLLKELVKKIRTRLMSRLAHLDDNNWRYVSLKRKAANYLEEFLKPCEKYVQEMKDIFRPTKFDVMTFSGKPVELCSDPGSEFCNHWKLFRTCEAYTKAKQSKLIVKIERILDHNDW